MVARYKKKRLAEEMSYDSPPKSLKIEGSERGHSKNIVRLELEDYNNLAETLKDEEFEEDSRKAEECYRKELAYGPGYRCTCFNKLDN